MNYELIYDIAQDSQAPKLAFLFGAALAVATGLWVLYLRIRALPLHAGVKFLGALTGIIFLLGGGYDAEQRYLAGNKSARQVEGPITGYWTRLETRSGEQETYEWEGFIVGGVPFVYARNVEQNAFHNAGENSVVLADGMQARIRYVPLVRDGRPDNQILVFELARP
ncbi:hypothetical protein [Paludibaculum fermentans]|uniref:Uncharacterized protein n=1 Tax=Paludibaculum fermentans TaxID=1473598 RepID=A0A7S7SMZ8_PALFE|nr:hypothetical protein [Paludibaculum fermentans]QOY91852.1 hypothetical protein IRI77_18490 [Paludibaculum fermentans]